MKNIHYGAPQVETDTTIANKIEDIEIAVTVIGTEQQRHATVLRQIRGISVAILVLSILTLIAAVVK